MASATTIMLASGLAGTATAATTNTTIYNAIPSALPPNVASWGFETTSTAEFGDYVHLAGTNRKL